MYPNSLKTEHCYPQTPLSSRLMTTGSQVLVAGSTFYTFQKYGRYNKALILSAFLQEAVNRGRNMLFSGDQ